MYPSHHSELNNETGPFSFQMTSRDLPLPRQQSTRDVAGTYREQARPGRLRKYELFKRVANTSFNTSSLRSPGRGQTREHEQNITLNEVFTFPQWYHFFRMLKTSAVVKVDSHVRYRWRKIEWILTVSGTSDGGPKKMWWPESNIDWEKRVLKTQFWDRRRFSC